MNWPEFFKAFSDAAVIIIIVLGATYVKVLNTKLGSIQQEAKDAKKHAEETVQEVRDSRKERSQQISELTVRAADAFDHANNTNDKIAQQNREIIKLQERLEEMSRRLPESITEIVKRLKP